MRGPFVYCFEGVDNTEPVQELRIPENSVFEAELCRKGVLQGLVVLKGEGLRLQSGDQLYSEKKPLCVPAKLKAIPYFAWGNRGVNQMRVWMMEA